MEQNKSDLYVIALILYGVSWLSLTAARDLITVALVLRLPMAMGTSWLEVLTPITKTVPGFEDRGCFNRCSRVQFWCRGRCRDVNSHQNQNMIMRIIHKHVLSKSTVSTRCIPRNVP